MRIWVCSLLLLFGCSYSDSLREAPARCGEKCVPDEYKEIGSVFGTGECYFGTITCDENFKFVSCDGATLPSSEICDNLDNDCNGSADDLIYPIREWNFTPGRYGLENYPCLTLGACAGGLTYCEDGAWRCSYYGSCVEVDEDYNVVANETRCDGCDNDCDGRVDEDVFDDWDLSDRVCYSGNPQETAAFPPCRVGLFECVYGETICLNEVTPSIELCDGVDNDCNGVTDDTGDVLLEKYDIVFIIDTSGSMCGTISAVAGACNAYAAQFDGNTNFRFALVIMSSNSPPYVRIDTDFTDFASIRGRLQSLGCNGGGAEASLDSLHQVCDKANNPLALSWRPDANSLLFALTDEPQQTYLSPPTTGQSIIDVCIQSGTLPFIWSNYPGGFQYIAQGANGQHFNLVNNWQQIFNDMNSIVVRLCDEGD